MPVEAWVYLSLLVVMSLITLATYAWDKRTAVKGTWRVSEARLHLLELGGGWPGGLLGRWWLRHKSVKLSFRLVSWLVIVLHGAMIAGWTWWRFFS